MGGGFHKCHARFAEQAAEKVAYNVLFFGPAHLCLRAKIVVIVHFNLWNRAA